jgi:hypothetical protein
VVAGDLCDVPPAPGQSHHEIRVGMVARRPDERAAAASSRTILIRGSPATSAALSPTTTVWISRSAVPSAVADAKPISAP